MRCKSIKQRLGYPTDTQKFVRPFYHSTCILDMFSLRKIVFDPAGVWVSSRSWWWIGKPGVLQSTVSQGVKHDWVTELNWTERDQVQHGQWSGLKSKRQGLQLEKVSEFSMSFLCVFNTHNVSTLGWGVTWPCWPLHEIIWTNISHVSNLKNKTEAVIKEGL